MEEDYELVLNYQIVRDDDLNSLVKLHRECLSVGLFAQAPEGALRRWYKFFLKSDRAVNLGVWDEDNNLIGFCSVEKIIDSATLFRQPLLISNLLVGVLCNPSYLRVLINYWARKFKDLECADFEIVVLFVSKTKRGVGIGERLINSALDSAVQLDVAKVRTRTHNQRLVDYYIRKYGGKIVDSQNLGPYYEFVVDFNFPPSVQNSKN